MARFLRIALIPVLAVVSPSGLSAQELQPRTYTITPPGLNFVAAVHTFLTGNIAMDPALPIEGLEGDIHLTLVRYTRTFSLAGRSARFKLLVPYSSGDWQGVVVDEKFANIFGRTAGFNTRSAAGLADARLNFEWNFTKSPAPAAPGSPKPARRAVTGWRIQLVAPTGEYEEDRLINLGSNRWSVKTEIGGSKPVRKWDLEGSVGLWLFDDNDEFVQTMTLSQDPFYVAKGILIYNWRPGMWLASGIGFGIGGRTEIDGVSSDTKQRNWILNMTFAFPLRRNQGVFVALGKAITDKAGPEFDTVAVGYQYGWGSPKLGGKQTAGGAPD